MEAKIVEGIVIGASGGALAGMTVYFLQAVHKKLVAIIESRRIREWLDKNTIKGEWRTTRAIASWTNLPVERVQYLCSHDRKIKLSTGEKENVWGLRSKHSD